MTSTQHVPEHATGEAAYPSNVYRAATLKDGLPVVVRSIRPDDTRRLARFHETLSDETVRSRYFHYVRLTARILESRLAGICRPDPNIEAVIVAIVPGADGVEDQMIGVGRIEEMNSRIAEISIIVSDPWQHRGAGRLLVDQLIEIARGRGLGELVAYTLTDNIAMQRLCQRLGFTVVRPQNAGTLQARLVLKP